MSALHAFLRAAGGTAARAVGLAVSSVASSAGLHHVTADSSLSWCALALGVVVLAGCTYPVLRAGAEGRSVFALAAVQALLPLWSELADTKTLVPALDDHLRLPSAIHHSLPVMAVLYFLAALALVHVFRSAADLPSRLSYALAATARGWWDRLLYVRLVLCLTGSMPSALARPPLPAVALPRSRALTVLLHRLQSCAP